MTITSTRWPWGSGAAPALRCDECSRQIGLKANHSITETGVLLCGGCVFSMSGTRGLHAKYHPDCEHDWHDLWDHPVTSATRAGAWWALTRHGRSLPAMNSSM